MFAWSYPLPLSFLLPNGCACDKRKLWKTITGHGRYDDSFYLRCAILLGEDAEQLVRDLQDSFPRANLIAGDADFEQLVAQVVGFIEAPGIGLDLPLDVRGTAFQQRVWQALREIPVGQTVSYTDIARRIGSPGAVRAVALACATNRLAVAIPCHRVVRNDGTLAGYRWGVERKRSFLEKEAAEFKTTRQTIMRIREAALKLQQS